MAKLFSLIFLSLLPGLFCGENFDDIFSNEEYTDDVVFEPRVADGTDALPSENLDFARLAIVFQNYNKVCGGSLFLGLYVLTVASCVYE